jgi:hypothetical protein
LILSNAKSPKKVLKKLPLCDEEIEQFERILSGKEELEKLDNRFTDYLIYLDQIKKRRLELHRKNDYVDYTKFKYIGPGGILHTKPSGDPKSNTKYYKKVTSQRISAPRTANMRSLNNLKCVKYVETIGRKNMQEKKPGGNHPEYQSKSERIALPTASPRIKRFRRQVLDSQDKYYSAQKKVNQLTRELQLRTNRPEYQRRCQEIRKELCDKIDETVWKQKEYQQKDQCLRKMINQRTFTRVERAFSAKSTSGNQSEDGNPNNISQSFDQGSAPNLPVKLSTKEKLRQLHAMLQQLEHDVG